MRLLRDKEQVIGAELTAPEALSRCGRLAPTVAASLLPLGIGDVRTDVRA